MRHEDYTLLPNEWLTVEKLQRTYQRYGRELLDAVDVEFDRVSAAGYLARSKFFNIDNQMKSYARRRSAGTARMLLAQITWTTMRGEMAIVSFWLAWDTERIIVERNQAAK